MLGTEDFMTVSGHVAVHLSGAAGTTPMTTPTCHVSCAKPEKEDEGSVVSSWEYKSVDKALAEPINKMSDGCMAVHACDSTNC